MKAHLYAVFAQWNDEKLLAEYAKKNEYQSIALEVMKQVIQERGLLSSAEQIDIEYQQAVEQENLEIEKENEQISVTKQRHWFVTVWLFLILLVNIFFGIINIIYIDRMKDTFSYAEISDKILFIVITLPFLNIFFISGLFNYKRWGFYGLLFTAGLSAFTYIAVNGFSVYAVLGFAGIAILYGILQITKNGVTAWEHMD